MKAHVGLDAQNGLVYSMRIITAGAANNALHAQLLHGKGQVLGGESACGTMDVKRHCRRQAGIVHLINDEAARPVLLSGKQRNRNRQMSSIRAKVEFPFRIIKHLWHHHEVCLRGLVKKHLATLTLVRNHSSPAFALRTWLQVGYPCSA